MILKIFNVVSHKSDMAGIFDLIPVITVTLFALGLIGAIAYEKTRSNDPVESTS